jgi:Flp pilus assembly protein TadD
LRPTARLAVLREVSLVRGDLAGAHEHQERALALDPAHSGAMNELGRIKLRRHDTAGAIRHFVSAARATPDEHIYSARSVNAGY